MQNKNGSALPFWIILLDYSGTVLDQRIYYFVGSTSWLKVSFVDEGSIVDEIESRETKLRNVQSKYV